MSHTLATPQYIYIYNMYVFKAICVYLPLSVSFSISSMYMMFTHMYLCAYTMYEVIRVSDRFVHPHTYAHMYTYVC